MTRDEILAMARAAGLQRTNPGEAIEVVRFATLVAAAEREVCASIAADTFYGDAGELNHVIATAIRQRGAA